MDFVAVLLILLSFMLLLPQRVRGGGGGANEPAYLKQRPFIVDTESTTQRGETDFF